MDDELNDGDVETVSKRGQWVNRVIGGEELSASFSTKEEAVDAGRALATQLGSRHIVRESDPTGVITDEDPATADEDLASTDEDPMHDDEGPQSPPAA